MRQLVYILEDLFTNKSKYEYCLNNSFSEKATAEAKDNYEKSLDELFSYYLYLKK